MLNQDSIFSSQDRRLVDLPDRPLSLFDLQDRFLSLVDLQDRPLRTTAGGGSSRRGPSVTDLIWAL